MSKISTCIFIFTLISDILGFKLHEHMTKREVKLLFNHEKSEIDNIHYEMAHVLYKKKRDIKDQVTIELQAFDEKYINYLEETDNILFGWNTPMFVAKVNISAKTNESNIYYEKVDYPIPGSKINFFQNRKKRSALTAHTDKDGKTHINGILDGHIFIRSIPNIMVEKYLSNHTHLLVNNFTSPRKFDSKKYTVTTYHIAIRKKSHPNYNIYPSLRQEWNLGENSSSQPSCYFRVNQKRPRAAISNSNITVFPEILIVIDYETFKVHDQNYEGIATYMGAFWNAVDLNYKKIKNPEVRLNIAGLVVIGDPRAEPYVEIDPNDRSLYLGRKTLDNIGKYFHLEVNKKSLCNFDIVVGMSQKTLRKSGSVETTGMAYVGAVCWSSYSATIITDKGFMGIDTAAHEMGHLFGAVHDGDDKASSCPSAGYIMASGTHKKSSAWSECSISAMQSIIRNYGNCLVNKPDILIPHTRRLPGKVLSRDEQCNRIFPGYKSSEIDNCKILNCKYCRLNYIWCDKQSWGDPPAEGTVCGKNKFCLNSTCVDDPGWYDQ